MAYFRIPARMTPSLCYHVKVTVTARIDQHFLSIGAGNSYAWRVPSLGTEEPV